MNAPPSATELLTQQFYDWELRGRGWDVWSEPVDIEPPFRPFLGHYLPPRPVVDDGQFETPLSRFADRFLGRSPAAPPVIPEPETEPEPEFTGDRDSLIEFQTLVPPDHDSESAEFEPFLLSLSLCRQPIAFEFIGRQAEITVQLAMHPSDAPLVRHQFQAFFPSVAFLPVQDMLQRAWQSVREAEAALVEFGLGHEFMRPLPGVQHDPYVALVGALAELRKDEVAVFQVLFAPVQNPWAESVLRAVTDNEGGSFFVNAPELVKEAQRKVSRPLYATVVRLAAKSPDFDRAWEMARNVAGALRVFCDPAGNELIPLTNDEYPPDHHELDLLHRQSRRSGMLLNAEELVGFVHLPSANVSAPSLRRLTGKTKPVPPVLNRHDGLLLGHNIHAGESTPVRLAPEQRVRHCHIVGASGTGKSTLLFNLIRQDIEAGEGLAVLDPHGDLIDRVLEVIPERRVGEVILLDPSDEEYSIGLNVLSAHSDLEKNLLASDLVSVFQRLSTSWGDQMGSVLQNAILAFLESRRGGTLADLRRFLLDAKFRNEFIDSVCDPDIVYYWRKGFPQLSSNKSIGPVLTRLETFLAPKPIRYMVSQAVNRLDFAEIMDTGKILLAKLPQGLLGRENSYLLGTLLVSKFQQLAMARQAQAMAVRKDFWLYVDEFHNFITPSMAEILSGARKYRIGLVLAHQELRQLQRDAEVASAVLSNSGTRICFRVGDDDARKLAGGFASFEARDLQNLETGQAICRVERSDWDFNLQVSLPEKRPEGEMAERRDAVIAASRKKYATPRVELEAKPEVPTPKLPDTGTKRRAAEATLKPSEAQQVTIEAGPTTSDLDDGEPLHTAVKERIGRQAEGLDYTVAFEEFVLDSQKRVDVVLRRGNRAIACEVCVTNTAQYEIGNVTKCLKAGFREVVVVCPTKRKLSNLEQAMRAALPLEEISRVTWRLPEEFIEELVQWAAADPSGGGIERGKPRKQKITLDEGGLTEEERREREREMLKSLAAAMRRPAGA